MSRLYRLTWPARVSGFFGFVCLFAAYLALSKDATVVRVRDRLLNVRHMGSLHSAGILALVAALLSLALAVYTQLRFGPPLSAVGLRFSLWPPRDAHAWLGIIAFIIGLLAMLAIVMFHVAFTFMRTPAK